MGDGNTPDTYSAASFHGSKGVDFAQKAKRAGDATNAPAHDTEEVTSMPDKTTSDDSHDPVMVIANAEQIVAEVGNNRPERCPVCGGLNPGDITHARC